MTDFEQAVLRAMEGQSGATWRVTTSHLADFVARQPGRESNRKHSAAILQALSALEATGRVRRLDDYKPIAWCRAPSHPSPHSVGGTSSND